MGLVSNSFVIDQFTTENYVFFDIVDESNPERPTYTQAADISTQAALSKLKNHLANMSGNFCVRVYSRKFDAKSILQRDKYQIASFNVSNIAAGIAGAGSANYAPVQYVQQDDPMRPNTYHLLGQMSQIEQQMRLMEKDHHHYRELKELQNKIDKMEEDAGKARGMGAIVDRIGEQFSDPAVLLGLISGVSKLFNKQQPPAMVPINGIDSEVEGNIDNRKKTLVDAINKLMNLDPDFSENMAKLARLAETNPTMYRLAITQLNSL